MTRLNPTRIGDLVANIDTWVPEREAPDKPFTYVDLGAIDADTKQVVGHRQIMGAEAPSRARQIAKGGDVLVSTVRPNLNGVARLPSTWPDVTVSTGFCVLRADPVRVEGAYLFHWVRSRAFVSQMARLATGASYPAVTDRIVHDSRLPLPSLQEQRRIADILDKADALRAKRCGTIDSLDTLIRSVFREMFQATVKEPAVDTSKRRTGLPQGWSWRLLTDVAQLGTGHTPDRERSDYWNGGIPWISLTDIRGLDAKVAHQTNQTVSLLGIENSSSVILPAGTVCFSRTASVGFVTIMGRDMATSQDFVNWTCGGEVDPTYLMWALLTSRRRLQALSSGSTHKTIYMRVVEQFHVLVPPLSLQQKFASVAAAVSTQQGRFGCSLAHLDDLFAALQRRAFRGELL